MMYSTQFKKLYFFCLLCIVSHISFAADSYKLDPEHTYAIWQVSHFGFTELSGKFMASGTLLLDRANLQNSKVSVKIDISRTNTGIPELDDILTGKNFFYTTQFPDAKFVSNKIILTGKNTAKIFGTITIRNISKPIVLVAKLTQQGLHPYYKKAAIGFTADGVLKRSDFGLRGYLPGISDDVKLHIQAEGELN